MRSIAATLAALLLAPATSFAWVRTPTCYENRPGSVFQCLENETPIPITWPELCIGYLLQQDGSVDVGPVEVVGPIADRAFDHWSDVECANISFGDLGTTAERAVGVTSDGQPNGNVVMFVSQQWAYPGAVQALTTVTYRIADGIIVDADMEFNEQVFNLGIVEGSGSSAVLDLENVMTHEAGHFLGLDHAVVDANFVDDGEGVGATTMFATAGLGETNKRTLSADDIAGVCEIYPADQTCVCSFGDEITQSCTVPRDERDGCAAAPMAGVPGLWLLVSGVVLLARRRRA